MRKAYLLMALLLSAVSLLAPLTVDAAPAVPPQWYEPFLSGAAAEHLNAYTSATALENTSEMTMRQPFDPGALYQIDATCVTGKPLTLTIYGETERYQSTSYNSVGQPAQVVTYWPHGRFSATDGNVIYDVTIEVSEIDQARPSSVAVSGEITVTGFGLDYYEWFSLYGHFDPMQGMVYNTSPLSGSTCTSTP